jgi:hypothetical protein
MLVLLIAASKLQPSYYVQLDKAAHLCALFSVRACGVEQTRRIPRSSVLATWAAAHHPFLVFFLLFFLFNFFFSFSKILVFLKI